MPGARRPWPDWNPDLVKLLSCELLQPITREHARLGISETEIVGSQMFLWGQVGQNRYWFDMTGFPQCRWSSLIDSTRPWSILAHRVLLYWPTGNLDSKHLTDPAARKSPSSVPGSTDFCSRSEPSKCHKEERCQDSVTLPDVTFACLWNSVWSWQSWLSSLL